MRLIDADVVELKLKDDFRSNKIGSGLFMDIMQYLKEAKSIEAEPTKYGKWIYVKGSNGKDYRKCTECLHTQDITGLLNYCPSCGARMEW